MSCGQYHGTVVAASVGADRAIDASCITIQSEHSHTGGEMHFAACRDYRFPHGFYDFRQPVGAYMGMGVDKYLALSAVEVEYLEYFVDRTAFFAAGVEFAVGVGSRASFTEAIIGVGVDCAFAGYGYHVASPAVDVFAAFEYYGFDAEFYKLECREKSGRTGSDYYD